MIVKEFGKCIGVCDVCGEETPAFDTWEECLHYIRRNYWKKSKNPDTGDWENVCPECQKI